jgi:hypothetical protein
MRRAVLKSGNLNLLEPSGPIQTCDGNALTLLLCTEFHVDRMQNKCCPQSPPPHAKLSGRAVELTPVL